MEIVPSQSDFRNWSACVPTQGDLVFLDKAALKKISHLPFPVLSTEDVRAQAVTLWSLNTRSWYGYALNRTVGCIWLPRGAIERLGAKDQENLAAAQIRLEVPTLILPSRVPAQLKAKLPKFGKYHWLTSQAWKHLGSAQRRSAVAAWFVQNEIVTYRTIAFKRLPLSVQHRLAAIGFDELLNRYALESGSNCLATAAGALATSDNLSVVSQWLHGPPFLRFLKKCGYKKIRSLVPNEGDAMVFTEDEQVAHAAYYLGEGLYFEKLGQDFYEPYRVESFRNWKSHWSEAKLTLWRKNESNSA